MRDHRNDLENAFQYILVAEIWPVVSNDRTLAYECTMSYRFLNPD